MKILVANLGSTSFKYRLYQMPAETQLARGGMERIGRGEGRCFVEIGSHRDEWSQSLSDHAAAVRLCLERLADPQHGCLEPGEAVDAIGFKAVFAGPKSGVRLVDEPLLEAMEELADVAPAHNPPYVRAMRQLREAFPQIPLVAALETGFHETIPPEYRTYAIPYEWTEQYGIRRWGFHGASHRYIAGRVAEITGRDDLRIISCHLGGSSSLCAIRGGRSVFTSMGMSPQSGLPQNNRVGDFDPFALPVLLRATGKSLAEILDELASRGGLLGMSGHSGDLRDLEQAADSGNGRARLALDVYVAAIRNYLGMCLVALNGADMVVFTGGIGENGVRIREAVCRDFQWAGLELDGDRNQAATGEAVISTEQSRIEVRVIPTNEELVVARQAAELLASGTSEPAE